MKNLPLKSDWFICYVNGTRLPLKFNQPNSFWVGIDGKTYKPNEVKWIDDAELTMSKYGEKFEHYIIQELYKSDKA